MPLVETDQLFGALFLLGSSALGCTPIHRVVPSSKGQATRPLEDRLATMLDAHCVGCHTNTPNRPNIDAALVRADRSLSMRSALMIASRQMPPLPMTLDVGERDQLVASLCKVGAPSPERCVAALAPNSDAKYILNADEMLRAMSAVAAAPNPDETVGERMLREHDEGVDINAFLAPRLDPTFETALTLIAAERCSRAPDFERCVERVLRLDLISVPDAP